MARQVLPIVGAAVGAWIGGAAGARWGYVIGSIVGNAVDPQEIQGPKIGDVAGQTSSEGVYQPIYFGTAAGAGNMIAQGPNIIKKVKQKQGKGGPVTVSERLYKTFAIRIGVGWNGPIAGISRIWEDEKLVYDVRPESELIEESVKFAEGFRLYLGTQDQLPDPDLEAIYGIGNTPAYPGRAYIVFPKKDITDRRSISSYRFEVVTGGTVTIPGKIFAALQPTNGGIVYSSEDGDTFPTTHDTGLGNHITRFFSAGDYLYAFRGVAAGRVSRDRGVTWEPIVGLANGGEVNGIAHANGVWIMCYQGGGVANVVSRSENGINFSDVSIASRSRYCIAAINDTFVTGGSNLTIDVSVDAGFNWTNHQLPLSGFDGSDGVRALVATNLGFVAATVAGSAVRYSPTGLSGSWTNAATGLTAGGGDPRLSYRDELTIIAANLESATSGDGGATWSAADALPRAPYNFSDIGVNSLGFFLGTNAGSGLPSVMRTTDASAWLDSTFASGGSMVAVLEEQSVPVVAGQPLPLSDIVSTIHGFTKQDASKYDVTNLASIDVDGLILAGGYTGADAIRTLAGVYFFDSPEIDKKIVHRLRGAPVVYTFTIDDLVDDPEESTRGQAIEYPKKLHLDYQNAAIEYAPAKATSTRESQDIRVVGEASMQAPVVMDADTAAQKARILHKIAWADLDGEVPFTVPDNFLWLVPGDCVGLSLRGQVRRLRIDRQEYNPGTIKLYTRNDRQSAYTTNVTGVPVPTPTPPPPSITGPSEIEALDIPALLDVHDQPAPVRYIAVGGLTPAWYGATVQESLDAGANYSGLIDNFSPGTLMGTLLAAVTDASEDYTDTTNVLHIQFDDTEAEVDSLTDAQFLSEGGALAVENADGSWEIMQYRDADDLGDGEYQLSHLLRGRLNSGTEAHLAGRRVVVLDGVRVVSTQSSYIGQSIVHRAISFGTSPETGVTDTITYEAKSQTEWPIASFTAERTGDTINGTIVPRHRFGTEDAPVRSTNWAGYRITYEEGGTVNSIITLSDDFSLDVTGYGSPVDVTISQLNRITGAGPSVSESIA